MALIECPECGQKISDKAISCPGCGFPLSQERRQSARREFPFITPLGELAAMVEGFAAGLREALHREERPRPEEPSPKQERPEDKS